MLLEMCRNSHSPDKTTAANEQPFCWQVHYR